MASLLDIEDTLSDNTTKDIVCKQWYWDEFLPKIDEDNIRNDYRLVYQEFSENEWMSLPYNYPEYAWEWLLENKIMVLSCYDDSDLYGWYDKHEDQPIMHRNVNDCYKYRLTDKFFEDYQAFFRKKGSTETFEWIYRAYYIGQRDYNMKNYGWPTAYIPSI